MAEAAAAVPTSRHQRRLRNYLLDSRFQLKYAGYFVAIAVLLSLALGAVLWVTSTRLVDRGRALVEEGQKVSQVVRMNIVKDPVYGEDPDLLKAFEEGDQQYTGQLQAEQAKLEGELASMKLALAVTLSLFVVFVGLAGILVTHKVAGPVFKMKRQINEVAEGKLRPPGKLRRGDELVEFFASFDAMVRSLRERQEREIATLDRSIERLGGKASDEDIEPLRQLREQMRSGLEA